MNYLHSILLRDPTSMLYKFFITQWHNPIKGDWSLQVRADMEDLDIPCPFDYIKNKATNTFKTLVKKKVQLFAFKSLKSKQQKHSKMVNVRYEYLKMQSYLLSSELKLKEKRTLFKYKVRMARFGENFRGEVRPATHEYMSNRY